eukprot:TRINITY_DN5536_c0_g1_i1.p1 TRINITY_DN5536_c0_g1~~TRINITY_DN5536_c0_g1_i1.p1  ORF type:complete len:1494 (+),score=401.34 TRINITY_DN5536_c0_g1_i1:41-4522(+)
MQGYGTLQDVEEGLVRRVTKRSLCEEGLLQWIWGIFWMGAKGAEIGEEHVPWLPERLTMDEIAPKYIRAWRQEKLRAKPSLTKLSMRIYKLEIALFFLWGLIQGIAGTIGRPLLLKYLIEAATHDDDKNDEAMMYVGCLGALLVVEGATAVMGRVALSGVIASGICTGLTSLIHDKSLRLTSGSISTERALVGNDITRLYENSKVLSQLPSSATSMVGGTILILITVSYEGIAGIVMLAIVLFVNRALAKRAAKEEAETLAAGDVRIQLITRVIEGIKAVKLSAWEVPFENAIKETRKTESYSLSRFRLATMSSIQVGRASPALAACVTFGFMFLMDAELNVADVFAAYTAFQAMRLSMVVIPRALTVIATNNISLDRIQAYLLQEEHTPTSLVPKDSHFTLHATGCSFQHRGSDKFTLKLPSLTVKKGAAHALVGPVGSGKTSTITAVLGDLDRQEGTVMLSDSVGYVPQKSFITCGTVLENITMGRPLDENMFRKVVQAAALEEDLKRLHDGRYTQIGERGVTLSGGQQQRVCIARALYGDPDLLIMDDPLAAVDGMVAAVIFDRVVASRREGQSILMSINQLQFLNRFTDVTLLEEGEVVEQGAIADHMNSDSRIGALLTDEEDRPEQAVCEEEPVQQETGKKTNDLVSAEKRKKGAIKDAVMITYFKSMGAGWVTACFVSLVITYGLMAFCDRWLAAWTSQYDEDAQGEHPPVENYYLYVFVGASVAFAAGLIITSACFSYATVAASLTLHNDCFDHILHAPLSWFESTPSGRILSRFSADMANVDTQFGFTLDNIMQKIASLIVLLVMICVIVPLITPIIVFAAVAYYFEVIAVDRSNRQIKRYANNSMSPILSSMGDIGSAQGRLVIRSMNLQHAAKTKFYFQYDDLSMYNYASVAITHFGMQASYLISIIISCATGTFILYGPGNISSSLLGLAMTYSFMLPYFFLFFSLFYSRMKSLLTSLERLLECKDASVPQEPEWFEPTDAAIPSSWPEKGNITFDDATLVYRPGLPPALNEVDLEIKGGSTVGVVGRTGAGKSSLVVLLFRLRELAAGKIKIDGTDISRIGLQTLRKTMAVIPQEPLLIDDTVARNLDPFSMKPEKELRDVLDKVGLETVSLSEPGLNLSAGEKQLVSLARALLLPARIVIMDEPTSNIDPRTDAAVQRVIREDWSDRTVVTIAHRLNTIIDNDYILVMRDGRVAEYSTPKALLADPDTQFFSMVAGLGLGESTNLMKIASESTLRAVIDTNEEAGANPLLPNNIVDSSTTTLGELRDSDEAEAQQVLSVDADVGVAPVDTSLSTPVADEPSLEASEGSTGAMEEARNEGKAACEASSDEPTEMKNEETEATEEFAVAGEEIEKTEETEVADENDHHNKTDGMMEAPTGSENLASAIKNETIEEEGPVRVEPVATSDEDEMSSKMTQDGPAVQDLAEEVTTADTQDKAPDVSGDASEELKPKPVKARDAAQDVLEERTAEASQGAPTDEDA